MFGMGGKVDTLIGQGAELRGPISVDGAIVVDGKVEGSISATERITLGVHAAVRGTLQAPLVVVGGKLHGTVHASERAEILATAHIDGDIRAARLLVEDGATISGKLGMATTAATAEPKSNRRNHP
jgi:cytoskeletal protein CcmA (bactofilin family)